MQLYVFKVEHRIAFLLLRQLSAASDRRRISALTFSSRSSILRSISTIGLSRPLKCKAMTNVPGVGEVKRKKTFGRLNGCQPPTKSDNS